MTFYCLELQTNKTNNKRVKSHVDFLNYYLLRSFCFFIPSSRRRSTTCRRNCSLCAGCCPAEPLEARPFVWPLPLVARPFVWPLPLVARPFVWPLPLVCIPLLACLNCVVILIPIGGIDKIILNIISRQNNNNQRATTKDW